MAHLVLLGDSVFDNAVYVPDGLPVITQVNQGLSQGDRATLLAVDGNYIQDVVHQLEHLPSDATHLYISVGGNDALQYGSQLQNAAISLATALPKLASMKTEFSQNYQQMLQAVLALRKPTTLCTIYDQCPLFDPHLRLLALTALSMFNDCITRQAIEQGLPLIDLRVICDDMADYSSCSPIEPSTTGGQKIARCIVNVLNQHDFLSQRTTCYI